MEDFSDIVRYCKVYGNIDLNLNKYNDKEFPMVMTSMSLLLEEYNSINGVG